MTPQEFASKLVGQLDCGVVEEPLGRATGEVVQAYLYGQVPAVIIKQPAGEDPDGDQEWFLVTVTKLERG